MSESESKQDTDQCNDDLSCIAFHTLYYVVLYPIHYCVQKRVYVCLSRSVNPLFDVLRPFLLCCFTVCGWHNTSHAQKVAPFCSVGKHKQRTEATQTVSDTWEHSSMP